MTTPLQQAAQAMIDRWESPDWKDTPHTAHYVAELRKALDDELAQSVEPELYQVRIRPTWAADGEGWSLWVGCSKESASYYIKAPFLRGWEYETRTFYLHAPQPQATTPAVPEGYVLVPIEPTAAMLDAMSSSGWKYASYRSMLAAAQGEKP